METHESQHIARPHRNLTAPAALDRLLAMMKLWWEGQTVADIGRAHGVSRQRVAAILDRVGCTRASWRMTDHERPDSKRRVWRHGMEKARAALLHPLAYRLTVRQRAALAWQAQGLALPDIARRMRATSQNVRGLQIAAYWRLERLSKRDMSNDGVDIGMIEWADVARGAQMNSGRSNAPDVETVEILRP
jgi:DNA-binding CsgD family transcriptional regulator